MRFLGRDLTDFKFAVQARLVDWRESATALTGGVNFREWKRLLLHSTVSQPLNRVISPQAVCQCFARSLSRLSQRKSQAKLTPATCCSNPSRTAGSPPSQLPAPMPHTPRQTRPRDAFSAAQHCERHLAFLFSVIGFIHQLRWRLREHTMAASLSFHLAKHVQQRAPGVNLKQKTQVDKAKRSQALGNLGEAHVPRPRHGFSACIGARVEN